MLTRETGTDKLIELTHGRQLCYREYGNPGAKPVIAFHGNPNSRLIWGVFPEAVNNMNVRLIAPDRPGYGKTDFESGISTLEHWPKDVLALADNLGVESFAVFGASGGGPYALSCAYSIPERITCAGIFESVGPLLKETVKGMNKMTKALYQYGPRVPGLLKQQMKVVSWMVKKHPRLFSRMVKNEFGERDRLLYERLNLSTLLHQNRIEAYRQDGIGSWYDVLIPSGWNIPLEEIRAKVFLWHGEDDVTVPVAMGQYIAGQIPDCEALFLKDAGHLWIFEHFDQIINKLVESS